MAASLTDKQRTVVRLLDAYPQGYVYNVEDGTGPWRLRYSPAGESLRLDGRAVFSLQRRRILTGHAPPLTHPHPVPDRVWTLNRTHPVFLAW